jgi:galactose mutarotase-like enzyme
LGQLNSKPGTLFTILILYTGILFSDVLYNVKYSLEGGSLQLELSGAVTAPTPVNLVNHVYFNLAGHKAGADGTLWRDMHIYIYYVSPRIVD